MREPRMAKLCSDLGPGKFRVGFLAGWIEIEEREGGGWWVAWGSSKHGHHPFLGRYHSVRIAPLGQILSCYHVAGSILVSPVKDRALRAHYTRSIWACLERTYKRYGKAHKTASGRTTVFRLPETLKGRGRYIGG